MFHCQSQFPSHYRPLYSLLCETHHFGHIECRRRHRLRDARIANTSRIRCLLLFFPCYFTSILVDGPNGSKKSSHTTIDWSCCRSQHIHGRDNTNRQSTRAVGNSSWSTFCSHAAMFLSCILLLMTQTSALKVLYFPPSNPLLISSSSSLKNSPRVISTKRLPFSENAPLSVSPHTRVRVTIKSLLFSQLSPHDVLSDLSSHIFDLHSKQNSSFPIHTTSIAEAEEIRYNDKTSYLDRIRGQANDFLSTDNMPRINHRGGSRDLLLDGLSRSSRNLWRQTQQRQCFVTGRYPITVQACLENPTRRWLLANRNTAVATTELLVNGTVADQSLASYDRFQWLDSDVISDLRTLHTLSFELVAEIHVERPGYVRCLPSDGAGSSAAARRQSIKRKRKHGQVAHQRSTKSVPWTIAESLIEATRFNADDRGFLGDNLGDDRLWVTGFSLASRRGQTKSVDFDDEVISSVNSRTALMMQWPNEVAPVPKVLWQTPSQRLSVQIPYVHSKFSETKHQDALLVADGFLVPGKDRGGIYIVKQPTLNNDATKPLPSMDGTPLESTVCLTKQSVAVDSVQRNNLIPRASSRWFYHRASWVDLTGDGYLSILTARAQVSVRYWGKDGNTGTTASNGIDRHYSNLNDSGVTSGIATMGELLWLEMPKPDRFDPVTGCPLAPDGTAFDPFDQQYLPWKEHVLAKGPDVMFAVADLDADDDTIEVISSEFFNQRVTLMSIRKGTQPQVIFQRTIDDRCGAAFGAILADLKEDDAHHSTSFSSDRIVIDSGSTMDWPKPGSTFSHLLVTSHECKYVESDKSEGVATSYVRDLDAPGGGSLYAYRVPVGKMAWKTESWLRSTIASGFKVHGQLQSMINPGAPGLAYTFHAQLDDRGIRRPLIAVAGDCAESAYIFRPDSSANSFSTPDANTLYKLMVEVQTKSTVGSIAVSYDNITGYANLYIPCYEKDKVLAFKLGNGDQIGSDDDGW